MLDWSICCWRQASALVASAVERFDADSAAFKGAAPVAAARSALAEQLQRALYGPYRKQLAALQRLTLSKLRAKVSATKPAAFSRGSRIAFYLSPRLPAARAHR